MSRRRNANQPNPGARTTLSESTLERAELKRFLALKHTDPHSILGPHSIDGQLIVRTFRPDAEEVQLLVGKH